MLNDKNVKNTSSTLKLDPSTKVSTTDFKLDPSAKVSTIDLQSDSPMNNSTAEPVSSFVESPAPENAPLTAEPMPVEKNEAKHLQQLTEAPVLIPGPEIKSLHVGILGELENASFAAEKEGNHRLFADLHHINIKLGEIKNQVEALELNAENNVKSIYKKILSYFKK